MINADDLCMGCMKEIGNLKQCPHCGFYADSPQIPPYLPIRSVVGNRYLVGKVTEYNGEGATYMGWDLSTRAAVSVREFLPDAISTRGKGDSELKIMPGCEITFRDCYHSFLEMWRKLARLRGLSALISVIDIVEDHGTAYAISEYFEGATLREFLLRSKTGYISWDRARQLFMPVLSTLGTLHSTGIIHRGISPTTLLVGKDGKIRISGFSIWQARTAKGDLTAQLFPGYAAVEQQGYEGQQGAWTDIYAFAAVLYRSLIGSDPIDSASRLTNDRLMVPAKFAEQLPAYVINALINAMQILPDDRTRTVEQLRAELSASPSAAVAGEQYEPPRQEDVKPSPSEIKSRMDARKKAQKTSIKTALAILGAGLVVFFIIILAVRPFREFFFTRRDNSGLTTKATQTQAQQVKVPDFSTIGNYGTITSSTVWTNRFTFKAVYVFTDSNDDKNKIVEQSVKPGTMVAPKTEIVLTVSKGAEMIRLPGDLIGKDFQSAEAQLATLGFICKKIDKPNDGFAQAGTVFSVSPTVNLEYAKGTTIYLYVWGEPPGAETATAEETTAE